MGGIFAMAFNYDGASVVAADATLHQSCETNVVHGKHEHASTSRAVCRTGSEQQLQN